MGENRKIKKNQQLNAHAVAPESARVVTDIFSVVPDISGADTSKSDITV